MANNTQAEKQGSLNSGIQGFRLFRIFGFDVKLNLTWLLLGFLITWTLAAGLFPANYPDLAQSTYWWMGIAGAVGILFSIVFHELSHSLVARRFGLPMRGITLFIFGGIAEMEDEPASPKVEFSMAVAGPIASIVLGVALYQVEALARGLEWSMAVIGVVHYLALINIVLAVFNLFPAFPLDGGRMLRAALWHSQGDLRKATRISASIGSGFGWVLIFLGILSFIQGNFIGGMWWVLIGAFLRGAAKNAYEQLVIKEMLGQKQVRDFMNPDPITVKPNISLQTLLDDYIYRHHFKMFPVHDGERLLGCVTTDDVKKVPREQWSNKTVGDIVEPCSEKNTVSPDTDAAKLISAMSQPNKPGRYLVVENDQLVGLISMKDLREYIGLKLDLG